jgi:hypothetical protein
MGWRSLLRFPRCLTGRSSFHRDVVAKPASGFVDSSREVPRAARGDLLAAGLADAVNEAPALGAAVAAGEVAVAIGAAVAVAVLSSCSVST